MSLKSNLFDGRHNDAAIPPQWSTHSDDEDSDNVDEDDVDDGECEDDDLHCL